MPGKDEDMELYAIAASKLTELGIDFEVVEHEPAVTLELADKFIEGVEGVRTKTMFLTTKKKTAFFLLITEDGKRLDMEKFGETVGAKRIKLASADTLYEKMKLPSGVVSPFGLLNNDEHDIKVYIDEDIVSEKRMCFHPNTNEKTLFLDTADLLRYLEAIGYEPGIIPLD